MIYTLKECDPFEGFIKINIPSYDKRMSLVKDMQFKVKDGKVEFQDEVELGQKMVQIAKEYIMEIDLKKDEFEIKNFDDLSCFEEGMALINKAATMIYRGIPLGKK